MAREVTLGMFRQFMRETGGTPKEYIPEGIFADKLVNILNGRTNSSAPVNYINWYDIDVFIDWACEKTEKELRLPTEKEYQWFSTVRFLKRKMHGDNWEWTNQPYGKGKIIHRRLFEGDRDCPHTSFYNSRDEDSSFRLAEDF